MSLEMTAQELLDRYAAGDRDFAGVDLHGVDLSNAVLRGINLDRADLTEVNFTGADLSGDYGRRLDPLFKEIPGISTYPGKYSSTGLGRASGGYTCIRYAVLKNANFRDADVSYVDFSGGDLSSANFSWANCKQTFFDNSCLFDVDFTNANLLRISFERADVEGTILETAE